MKAIHIEKGQPLDRNCRICMFWTGSKLSGDICGAVNPECVYVSLFGCGFLVEFIYGKMYRNKKKSPFYRILLKIAKKLLAFTDGPLRCLVSKWHNVRSDMIMRVRKKLYRHRGKK